MKAEERNQQAQDDKDTEDSEAGATDLFLYRMNPTLDVIDVGKILCAVMCTGTRIMLHCVKTTYYHLVMKQFVRHALIC